MKPVVLIAVLLKISCIVTGQNGLTDQTYFSNHIFNEKIKTVQIHKEEWNLSYPVLNLKSEEKLVLHFDLLGDQADTYYYTFIHCNKDWEKTDIFQNEYINGYPENPVEEYESSFNTTVKYFHYKIMFPNENVRLSLSGNYIIVVYPFDKPDEPVLTQRFMVTEDEVRINVKAHRPLMTQDNNNYQQVDFSVDQIGKNIIDPYRSIYAFILQNGRWDNAKVNLKPEFYSNNELKYNSLSDKNIFYGGNEFRYFDIKSIRYQTEYVRSIDFVPPEFNVFLFPSESREFKPYFYSQDFNGKYYIAIEEGQKPDIDADYVSVFFTLPCRQKLPGGDVYVSGALNNWSCDKNNRMTYNSSAGQYECTMLLKQGWYNYEFAFLKDGTTDATASLFEGSHYETENDYSVLIYYRSPRERYDRLIGTATANTLNNLAN